MQEEHLYQPLQTINKQYKIAITVLTGYYGIFNLTLKNIKFYFMKSITDEHSFFQIIIPHGAYEIEALEKEIKRIIFDKGRYTEANHPFKFKPNFSTLGSIVEISPQGPLISFIFDDSKRDLLGFNPRTLHEKYKLSTNPVDIKSFKNFFIETDFAKE